MPKKHKKHQGYSVKGEENSVKALLVGINYRGTRNQLGGCINDALATRRNILSEYPNAAIELMTDDTPNKPTRDNILEGLKNLVDNAQPGDTLMFHYSGHGSQVEDYEGDEEDGMDETICPIDFMKPRMITVNGTQLRVDSQITDDEIHDIISNTPKGAKFLMLSDSCHSGTIGDLKNDFAHYQGPSEWQDNVDAPQGQPQSTQPPALKTITCDTYWVYAKYSKELWLTPLNDLLYAQFSDNKRVIKLTNNIPPQLANSNDKPLKAHTTFKQLANGQYEVSSEELGINGLLTTSSQRAPVFEGSLQFQVNPNAPLSEAISVNLGIKYNYDPDTDTHNHYSNGKKRSLKMKGNMKAVGSSCKGGELRIISGCEENQTSADTGTNGACTNAFWKAVQSMGGLHNFFPKLFSHNTKDFMAIEATINKYLAGYTQHSVLSWDHAGPCTIHASRDLEAFMPQQSYVPFYSSYMAAPVQSSYGYIASAPAQTMSIYEYMGGRPMQSSYDYRTLSPQTTYEYTAAPSYGEVYYAEPRMKKLLGPMC